tara:strand:+ start:302 stop:406 length:105 start_codon:yes stop_codon:yes gene_type:complete
MFSLIKSRPLFKATLAFLVDLLFFGFLFGLAFLF